MTGILRSVDRESAARRERDAQSAEQRGLVLYLGGQFAVFRSERHVPKCEIDPERLQKLRSADDG